MRISDLSSDVALPIFFEFEGRATMVRLMSKLDAAVEEFDHGGQRKRMTWLSGPVRTPGTGPEAFYSETLGEGAATRPHFHQVDQFQVFLEGCRSDERRVGNESVSKCSSRVAPYI